MRGETTINVPFPRPSSLRISYILRSLSFSFLPPIITPSSFSGIFSKRRIPNPGIDQKKKKKRGEKAKGKANSIKWRKIRQAFRGKAFSLHLGDTIFRIIFQSSAFTAAWKRKRRVHTRARASTRFSKAKTRFFEGRIRRSFFIFPPTLAPSSARECHAPSNQPPFSFHPCIHPTAIRREYLRFLWLLFTRGMLDNLIGPFHSLSKRHFRPLGKPFAYFPGSSIFDHRIIICRGFSLFESSWMEGKK